MAKGDQDHPDVQAGTPRRARRQRRPLRWLAEVVVVLLLGSAAATYQFDLGTRWFGATPPARDPARVQPPPGLQLPAAGPAPAVATPLAGGALDPAKVAAAVAPYLHDPKLGPRVAVAVARLGDDKVVYRAGPATVTPASTNKLLTVTAALKVLGPQARFRTSVRLSADHRRVVLVGGGDPFLASSRAMARRLGPAGAAGADLGTLARLTAAKLRAQGLDRVQVAYDTSLFSGPAVNPTWPPDYVTEGVVPPITALWADEGAARTGSGYATDPALAAAKVFVAGLRKAGVHVLGMPVHAVAATGDSGLADVQSAPLGQIVEKTLETSDNNAAEVIGHQVGLAERQRGSFAAGVVAVRSVLGRLGVPTAGDRLYDGSGLSRADRVSPLSLLGALQVAASDAQPELRQVLTGLPVAGFSGSLQDRFERSAPFARGRVRAKTGTLTGVSGLAGTTTDRQGDELVFVAVADRVAVPDTLDARLVLDRLAASLATCRCGTTP